MRCRRVGPARWKPPQPMPRWTGVKTATEFGRPASSPSHVANIYAGRSGPMSEDCLTLNIWAPPSANAPVFFWIHGGALVGRLEQQTAL